MIEEDTNGEPAIFCPINAEIFALDDLLLAFAKAIQDKQREEICATIKAEDDHCADGDYMMDSDDCIKVIRGTWKRPNWNPA